MTGKTSPTSRTWTDIKELAAGIRAVTDLGIELTDGDKDMLREEAGLEGVKAGGV